MGVRLVPGVEWYVDRAAEARGEPGIYSSFVAAVATALQARGEAVDPAWLMGASGWAFRIIMHARMSACATRVFDWPRVLPAGLSNAGWQCVYVSRLWHEDELRAPRLAEAHAAIVAGIDAGTPAVAWDLLTPEWGLIIGYDDDAQAYDVLAPNRSLVDPGEPLAARWGRAAWRGGRRPMRGRVPYAQLGQRQIAILSVTVPGEPNGRPREESLCRALQMAVAHAEGKEWTKTPEYQLGLAAYAHWTRAVQTQPARAWGDAEYLAGHWAGARCYARDFVAQQCETCPQLEPAARAYGQVADRLLTVWQAYNGERYPDEREQEQLSDILFDAARSEAAAIAYMRRCLPME